MFTNHPNLIGFAAYNNSELDIGVRFELDRHPRTEHLVCLAASTPGLCLVCGPEARTYSRHGPTQTTGLRTRRWSRTSSTTW